MSKTWLPRQNVTSWFDYYLTGFIFDQNTTQLSHTKFFGSLPGAWKYFIGDALVNAIIPAILLVFIIYNFYMKKGFVKKRKRHNKKNPDSPLPESGLGVHLSGVWNMILASKRTTLMGVLIGITAGLHIYVMKGMQLRFNVSNFGQLLTRMGHTGDVGILPLRKPSLPAGFWKRSVLICGIMSFSGWSTASLSYGATPPSGCPWV
jgi:hypothetical protein